MIQKSNFATVRAPNPHAATSHDLQPSEYTVMSTPSDNSRVMRAFATDPRIVVLHGTLLSLVRRDGRDLTARQLTAFLSVYMDEQTHTVSSLAELLHISRPGVTRIMDRLVQFDLVAREEDREDRRRVLVRRTTRGGVFFRELVTISRAVAAEVRDAQSSLA